MSRDLSVPDLKRLLIAQCPALILDLVPGARREGRVYSAPNPTRSGDRHGSFKIRMNGSWNEYDESGETASGTLGGDVLHLVAYVNGYPPKSSEGRRFAVEFAKRRLGLVDGDRAAVLRAKRQAGAAARRVHDDERRQAERKMARALDIWLHARALVLDPPDLVVKYLRGRGIDLARIKNRTGFLRFAPNLKHWAPLDHDGDRSALAGDVSQQRHREPGGRRQNPWNGPAMVARVVDANGVQVAVHCTWLGIGPHRDAKGRADIPNPKLMLGAVTGGFVPLTTGPSGLSVAEATGNGLVEPLLLTEGIETGLAEAIGCLDEQGLTGARVWACLSLSNIGNAPVDLPCVGPVVVSIENDSKAPAVKQREAVLAKLETRAGDRPVVTKHVHAGADAADLLARGDG